MKKILLLLIILSCFVSFTFCQSFTFEGATPPSGWSPLNGTLTLSSEHYKEGAQSLCWETSGKSQLIVTDFTQYSASTINSAYMQLYFPQANNDTLVVEFLNGTVTRRIANFLCNTRGWREFNRAYKEYANTATTNINALRFTLKPTNSEARRIYFDDIQLNRTTESGRVPGNQWILDRAYFTSNNTPLSYYANAADMSVATPSVQELTDLRNLRNSAYLSINPTYSTMQALLAKNYVNNKMNLSRNEDGTIKGRVINTTATYFSIDTITDIVQRLVYLAGAVVENGTEDMKTAFTNYLDHVLDQGFAEGCNIYFESNNYTAPRTIIPMILSIIPACNDEQKDAVVKLARWISAYNFIYEPEDKYLKTINSDIIYLFAPYMYTIAVCHRNDIEAVRELKAYKRFLERSVEYVPGRNDMLKVDGTGFHHNSQYNNYMYAYQSYMDCIYALKGTEFRISTDAYERFKKAIVAIYTMATRNTNDNRHYANSLSGRNPFSSGNNLFFSKSMFEKLIAVGGDCYGTSIDEELAGAYNYFFESTKYNVAENIYEGFFQFNYSPLGIFRKGNWVATMRAPTSNFWGAEIYSGANRFGRYQSHGSLEITYKGSSLSASGYPTNKTGGGWDWNVIPGTTTVHYTSWREMMPNRTTTDRFDQYAKSKNFSGALAFGNNGIFATDFDQIDNWGSQKFTPTNLVFKKSIFCFDDMIISLGSDISSSGSYSSDMITATNLFQNVVVSGSGSFIVNGDVKTKPYTNVITANTNAWMITPQGTGYYVFGNNDAITMCFDTQTTPKSDGSDCDSPITSINVAKAYLNHGVKPTSKKYSFIVLPETNIQNMENLASQVGNNGGNLFSIESHTSSLHAISYNATKTTGYAFFEAVSNIPFGIVKSTTSQHLLMVKEDTENNRYSFAVCNPNLNPQSNTDFGFLSLPTTITLTVQGDWKVLTETSEITNTTVVGDETQITITLSDGMPVYFTLGKQNDTSVREIRWSTLEYLPDEYRLFFYDDMNKSHSIEIFSIDGIKILSTTTKENLFSIKKEKMGKGLFIVKVSNGNKKQTFKLLVN